MYLFFFPILYFSNILFESWINIYNFLLSYLSKAKPQTITFEIVDLTDHGDREFKAKADSLNDKKFMSQKFESLLCLLEKFLKALSDTMIPHMIMIFSNSWFRLSIFYKKVSNKNKRYESIFKDPRPFWIAFRDSQIWVSF